MFYVRIPVSSLLDLWLEVCELENCAVCQPSVSVHPSICLPACLSCLFCLACSYRCLDLTMCFHNRKSMLNIMTMLLSCLLLYPISQTFTVKRTPTTKELNVSVCSMKSLLILMRFCHCCLKTVKMFTCVVCY